MTTVRAWLTLARISNLPTVLSNALAGAVLGLLFQDASVAQLARLSSMWIAIAIPCIIYCAGMILNDAFDASIDAQERPTRPIPSKQISQRAAFVVGISLLLLALALAACTQHAIVGGATVALIAAVLIYDTLHTKSGNSVLLLALCRALASFIPMLACAGANSIDLFSSRMLALPLALAAWTLGLSLLARSEADATKRILKPHTIGLLIGCLALIDAIALILCGETLLALVCAGLFVLARLLARTIAAS